MVKLFIKDKEYPVLNLSFVQDLNQLYATIVFSLNFYSPDREFTLLVDSKRYELQIISSTFSENTYQYTAITKVAFNTLNSSTSVFTGESTVQTLISQHLGFNCSFDYDSVSSYWSVPQMRFYSLLTILNRYTSVGNGGGARFFIDLDGNLSLVDYHKTFSSAVNKVSINGTVITDVQTIEWIKTAAGVINFYGCGYEGFQQEVYTIKEGYGEMTCVYSDNTGRELELLKQQFNNSFYINYYNSRVLTVTNTLMQFLPLGTIVNIEGIDKDFMVRGETMNYPLNKEVLPTIQLILVTCPTL